MTTNSELKFFIVVHIIGGVLVLGSYAWGVGGFPQYREALWGALSPTLRQLYTISMLIAAAGYLVCFAFLIQYRDRIALDQFTPIYIVFLLGSACWLPTTIAVLEHPQRWLWMIDRALLLVVGVAAVLLIKKFFLVRLSPGNIFQSLAWAGALALAWQTAILDALVWPLHFWPLKP